MVGDDSLYLHCEITNFRLCEGGIDDSQCKPWLPASGENSVFGISRINGTWSRYGDINAQLTLIKTDDSVLDDGTYAFEYSYEGNNVFLGVSRTTGEGMEVRSVPGTQEAILSMFTCKKVEKQF